VRVHSADPHMHHLVVYFTSHQARGSRPNRLQVGVYTRSCSVSSFKSLSLPYARPPRRRRTAVIVPGSGTAIRGPSTRPACSMLHQCTS
jgi:hypothetical protein